MLKKWLIDLADLQASKRDAYLARHCSDPALREEVLAPLADSASL